MSIHYDNPEIPNLWDKVATSKMSEVEKLIYRSNILGSDKRVTNYGGGNTSAKVSEKDPMSGDEVEVLWVKGSGGDLGSIDLSGLASLYMQRLNDLKSLYRGVDYEDEMVDYLPHCTFNLNSRAASIDTPLHAYVPKKHVDHVHADSIIAIAASKNSKELTQRIFGDEIGWLPWKRPGFELGLWLENFCLENPTSKGVVLESHGLFTWDDDAEKCYEITIEIINKSIRWFSQKVEADKIFGGAKIWSGEWLNERMAAYGKNDRKELEEHYRQRSLLKKSVYPEDIAEAAFFLASDQSAKSTENIINVDAGNIQSFTR